MARQDIGGVMNDGAVNGINHNFIELYQLHQRMTAIINDLILESGGTSNLEVVQARGGKPVLNDRLNALASEINDNRYEVDKKRDESIPIGINDVSQELLNAFNGGTDFTLLSIPRPKSVTPNKTTFFDLSSNLFNYKTIMEGYQIDENGYPIVNETVNLTDFIPVKPSTTYSRNYVGSHVVRYYYDANQIFIKRHPGENTGSFTTEEDVHYIRMTLNKGIDVETFQLNEGSSLTGFEKYFEWFDENKVRPLSIKGKHIGRDSVTPDKLSIINRSRNLIDKTRAVYGYGLNADTGEVVENETLYLSDWINVDENENYVRSIGYIGAYFYDEEKKYISRIVAESFTTPPNTAYLRLTMPIGVFESGNPIIELAKGDALSGEGFYEYINPKYIKDESGSTKKYNFVPEIPYYDYKADTLPAADGTGDFDHHNSKVADVYQKYDELIANHSDYVTQTLLGKDESNTHNIYKLELKPDTNIGDVEVNKLPTIFITCGMHGDGSGGQGDGSPGDPATHVFSMYYFIKELCENWKSSKALEYLRWNVNLVIIPIANPWGFDNKSRYNSNGVDLIRNFESNWTSRDTAGSGPFSEKEARHIRDAFLSEDNLISSIDYHMIGGLDYIKDFALLRYFFYADDNAAKQISGQTVRKLSREWRGNYGLSDIDRYGLVEELTIGGSFTRWSYYEHGVTSSTVEGFLATNSHQEKSGTVVMTLNVEFLGNHIMNTIKYFYNK